jgi:hypothetical protein
MGFLETKSKFVHENVIIIDFISAIFTLDVITGKEIAEVRHIGKVIGDFISAGIINFSAIGSAGKTRRLLVGLSLRSLEHEIQPGSGFYADSALTEPCIVHRTTDMTVAIDMESFIDYGSVVTPNKPVQLVRS